MKLNKALPILFIIMFLVMVGFGIIIPVLPFYAEELGASPTELGLLMAVYSLMQFIFAPMWGRISDRVGRKPVILIGIFGLSLSFFMMALSTQLWVLFVARFIGGVLSAANMPTVMAYVADITTEEDRGKGMGIVGAATGLGFIFGPAIGGTFTDISLDAPFYIAGIVSFATMFLVFFILKESIHLSTSGAAAQKKLSWRNVFQGPLFMLYFLQFFITVSLAGLEATFAYFAAERAGLDAVSLGYIFMIMGLASAAVQGSMGALTKKFGEVRIIQAGIFISALGFALILFTQNFITAAIFLSIFGVGNGVIRPSVSSLLTKKSTVGYGMVTGSLSSFDSLGRIIGPVLGGLLYSVFIGLPYISGIILSLFAFVLFRTALAKTNLADRGT
ncbi:multidrug resistance protein [Virgibacillus natechei]|uniref:Multidrug resistance protein n=1 Tax=Virgibacillus natechei TaxID=1216297 RepID=A0ABS4IHZ8_9BACI|nr:MFS transporter [Virgibacillus natechei]MBP1970574.1 multidrug resistance protein [Virgibacillus natechei]UZD14028.1 MFS transporter [Virgibacillus natechei]